MPSIPESAIVQNLTEFKRHHEQLGQLNKIIFLEIQTADSSTDNNYHSDIDTTLTHHVDPGGHRVLCVDLDDGGDAVLVLHVGVGVGVGGPAAAAAVGVERWGDVGESAKELVGGGARRDAGRV